MNPSLVIVFVDALPYEHIERLHRATRFLTWIRPLRPGFGYSVNVKSELFAGLVPDAAGFLNEWTYVPGAGTVRLRVPPAVWGGVSRLRLLKRGVSKALSRVLGEDLRNIPLPLLPSLVRQGHNAYELNYKRATLFGTHGIERFLYTEHGSDDDAFCALRRAIRARSPMRAFLAQCDLDHVMHKHGKGSAPYDATLARVDERLEQLWAEMASNGGGHLILVSDHGMAAVSHTVPFAIESSVRGAGSRYGYFVDATMARVWCGDAGVRREVDEWFARAALPGHVLSAEERSRWGITSAEFGDRIFLLSEGVMFAPNFFGDKGCKAMHGYWPELPSQLGVLAASSPLSDEDHGQPIAALLAYKYMSRYAETQRV